MARVSVITRNRGLAQALMCALAQGGMQVVAPTVYTLNSRGPMPESVASMASYGMSREERRQQRQQAKHSPKMQKMAAKSRGR